MTCLPVLAIGVAACAGTPSDTGPEGPHAPTIVSLTFDDTFADQVDAAAMLADHDMRGTFYVSSSRFGGKLYMTLAQALDLQARGHEIGGHTISHVRLGRLDPYEVTREICNDRRALLGDGFAVTSFAFPFGDNTRATDDLAKACGYNSARDVGGLRVPGSTCTTCPLADSIPPHDAYDLRTPDSADITTTLGMLEGYITAAEQSGGGWVPLVFHHVCDDCSDIAVSPSLFGELLDWLEARESTGTRVQTVEQVIAGGVQPAVAGPPARHIVNGSLELDRNDDGVPDCWQHDTTGTNDAAFAFTSAAFDGKRAMAVAIDNYTSGAAGLFTVRDDGVCAPHVFSGGRYVLWAHYIAQTPPHFTLYYRDREGEWHHLADGPPLPISTTYAVARYPTDPLPADATAISFGLSIAAAGSLTVDTLDYTGLRADSSGPPVTLTDPGE